MKQIQVLYVVKRQKSMHEDTFYEPSNDFTWRLRDLTFIFSIQVYFILEQSLIEINYSHN